MLQGNNVRVVTHTPLGGTRSVTVPVSDVSCSGSRIGKELRYSVILNFQTSQNSYMIILYVDLLMQPMIIQSCSMPFISLY